LLAGLAALALAGTAVTVLPGGHVERPDVARSLLAAFPSSAPRHSEVLVEASGRGSESLSRWMTGRAPQRLTTLLCRGDGRVELRYSDRQGEGTWTSCSGAAASLTRLLDAMPKDGFQLTVVVSGDVGWSLAVSNEEVRYDARNYPPCLGVEC
jgi:hypothetical protein